VKILSGFVQQVIDVIISLIWHGQEKIFRVVNDSVRGCQKVGNLEVRNQSIAREASNVMDSGYLLTANKNPNEKTVFRCITMLSFSMTI
jgi:hypothetical protein